MTDPKDAIQADAPQGDAPDVPETPRSSVLEQMLARRKGQRLDAPPPEADPPQAEGVAAPEPPPAPRMLRVKVDGEEREVSEDDLVRTFQKNAAADKRLAEAAEQRRQAAELRQQVEQQLAALRATPPEPPPSAPSPDARSEQARAVARRVAIDPEDTEEVDALAQDLLALMGNAQDPEHLVQRVEQDLERRQTQRLAQQFKVRADAADQMLATEYADVMADPALQQLVGIKARELFTQYGGLSADPDQIAREAADYVRGLVGAQAATPEARLERKRAATAASGKPNGARAPRPREQRPPTASERIQMMRERRGQARPAR